MKAVAQAIPTYPMSIFKISDILLDEINSLLARFWWGSMDKDQGMQYWKSWTNLCKPKVLGWLGFRGLKVFNLTLLAKQGWRLLFDDTSLLAWVLKARYFPKSGFLEANRGVNPSFTWWSVWGAKSLLMEGRKWRVGMGNNISVWSDCWLPR